MSEELQILKICNLRKLKNNYNKTFEKSGNYDVYCHVNQKEKKAIKQKSQQKKSKIY